MVGTRAVRNASAGAVVAPKARKALDRPAQLPQAELPDPLVRQANVLSEIVELFGESEEGEWSKDPVFAQLTKALSNYVDIAQSSGAVKALLIGCKGDTRMGFIWNVYKRDYQLSDKIEGFDRIERAVFDLKKELRNVLPLRIAGVQPARVKELKESCKSQGLELKSLNFSQ